MIKMNLKKFVVVNIACFGMLYILFYSVLSIFTSSNVANLITTTILSSVVIYSLMFFVLSRFFIPHLGFKKLKVPKRLPKNVSLMIYRLKKKSKNRYDYLKNVYNCLTKKYQGKRGTLLKNPHLLFETNLRSIWAKKGFLPCHTFNYLMRLFLVRSKMFKEKEIKIGHTFFNFNLHQYMEVKVKNKWLKVDPWARGIGIKFGNYARLFK